MSEKNSKQFYLGNRNLPTANAEFDYASNPKWIADIQKCRKNILYFAENFFFIVNLDKGKIQIELYNYQKKILRSLRDSRFVVLLASRQIGKSTLLTIYALWIACFNEDQNILIVANKESTAINIFKRVRLAYEQLPNYLKPGAVEYGKTSMTLGNGSSIGISTTSSDAGGKISIFDYSQNIPSFHLLKSLKYSLPVLPMEQTTCFMSSIMVQWKVKMIGRQKE